MKAWVVTRFGAPDVMELREVPDPRPGPQDVLVGVQAIGLNFADLFARMGVYPNIPRPPFIPGIEFAGVVVATGGEVRHIQPGQRVMGYSRQGSHAEMVVVKEGAVISVPAQMTDEEAAAFPAVSTTAYHALVTLAHVQAGERVLIHAAAGGVGLVAVQLAKSLRAEVFATASTAEKLDAVRAHGADHAVNYRSGNFADVIRRLAGPRRMDVILDSVGGRVFRRSWPLLAEMGRYILYGLSAVAGKGGLNRVRAAGVLAAMRPVFPSSLIAANKALFGFNLGTLTGSDAYLRNTASKILVLREQGAFRPVVGQRFPFEECVQAHRLLQTRKTIGKVVIVVQPSVGQ
jgi:NADPH:quinone reductase-like Zn-dependent oxidoreductase